jgi:hypothetical protein
VLSSDPARDPAGDARGDSIPPGAPVHSQHDAPVRDPVVAPEVEARQGRLGIHALVVLGVSLLLAVMAAIYTLTVVE